MTTPPIHPDSAPPPPMLRQSLYARSKITRSGITLFKRYPAPNDHYYVRFTAGGRRILRKLLRTAEDSFRVARRMVDQAQAGRFDALEATKSRVPETSKVGEIIARYQAKAPAARGLQPRTIHSNVNSLRLILRQAASTQNPDAAGASILTRNLAETYKSKCLASAGSDQLKKRTAAITANSTLRQARSLFAKKLGPEFYFGLHLPDLTGFLTAQFLPVETRRFRMPAPDLLQKTAAHAALLKTSDVEAYKVYLLALGTGLRKGEISHARLRWLESNPANPPGMTIRVQTESDFHVKDNEERCVPLDPFVVSELQPLLTSALPDSYLLAGALSERTDAVFRRFSHWLTGLGWQSRLKTHEMRKVFGSLIAQQAGIRAAQVLLGHASVSTTENTYADPAASIVPFRIFHPPVVSTTATEPPKKSASSVTTKSNPSRPENS